MTIAAGFECNDGIVLATDLEITEAMIKRTGGKSTFITSSGKAVAIAGSGFYDVVAYACEVLGEKKIAEGSFTDIVDNLRRGLDGIYRDHICLSYDPSEWDKVLQLLIGIVVDEGDDGFSSGLYVSSRSILRKTGPYDFIGYGRDLAFYVMQSRWTFTTKKGNLQPMNWKEHMFLPSVDKAIPLAKKVMEDVTENVPYCGHGVTILKVTSDGDASYVNP